LEGLPDEARQRGRHRRAPTDAQPRQFDRTRKGKKTSNDDWQSPSDPDARITKMKDGTTSLGYKAENAVDLDSEIVIAADVKPADAADGETVKDTIVDAQGNLNDATKHECRITHVVADKGYHKAGTLAWLDERDIRTYIRRATTSGSAVGLTSLKAGARRSTRTVGASSARRASSCSGDGPRWDSCDRVGALHAA
jgi:IS5 family transposase